MTFYTIQGYEDEQLFVKITDEKTSVRKNDFIFNGLFSNGIHPYHRKRINWIAEILKSKGIIINVAEVPTVNDMADDINDEFSYNDLKIPNGHDKISADGNVYVLFQDIEMGRGWACLLKNNEILVQEHRSNVLDELEQGEFIKSFDIDYEYQLVDDLDEYKKNYKI